MLCPVLYGDNTVGGYSKSRFFLYLFYGVFLYGYVNVYPTAGQRPFAVVLLDKKDFIPLENRCTRIQLRRLIPCFVAK